MNKTVRILVLVMVGFSLLACNLGNTLTSTRNAVSTSPVVQVSETPKVAQSPIPSSTQVEAVAQPAADLAPCSLVTTAEVEAILAEPASSPNTVRGGCTFTNAKDALYAVSVGAAQDQQTIDILQGQAMLLGFAGVRLDEARMTKLKTLAAALDYKGFFTELVAAAEGVTTVHARLVEDNGSDVVYWAWITAQNRRQGAFVAVRGFTLVNINLVVADTQSEESMLAASTSLADKIFERLPSKFTLAIPTTTPDQSGPVGSPTPVGGPTPVGSPTPPPRPRRPGAQSGRRLRRAPLNNLNPLKHRLLLRQPAWPAPKNTSITTKASGSPTDYFTPPLRRSARSSKKEVRKFIRFDLFFRGTNPPSCHALQFYKSEPDSVRFFLPDPQSIGQPD